MESKAILRMGELESLVENLLTRARSARERQTQLSQALAKSREEIESLKLEVERYKAERTDTRKKVDSLLRRFDSLELDAAAGEPKA